MKFTAEQRALADTVAKFVAKEINPYVPEWEAAEIYPAHAVMKKLGKLGLLGLKYPEEFGGAGLATIAVVEGTVMGGGFGLACVADVCLAGGTAQFRLPET